MTYAVNLDKPFDRLIGHWLTNFLAERIMAKAIGDHLNITFPLFYLKNTKAKIKKYQNKKKKL